MITQLGTVHNNNEGVQQQCDMFRRVCFERFMMDHSFVLISFLLPPYMVFLLTNLQTTFWRFHVSSDL